MFQKLCIIILLFSSTTWLVGCGFHLRGSASLPPQLHILYIQAADPYGGFEVTLSNQLRASGVTISNNIKSAPYILHVTSTYSHVQTSSGISPQARVYSLNYSATLILTSKSGQTILPPTSISVARTLTLSPNEVFEVSNQVETIKQEMQQDLTTKAMNILDSQNTFNLVTCTS